MDTLSLAWRSQGGSKLLSAVMAAPTFRSGRGLVVADKPASGLKVMAWPEHGLLAGEVRAGALLDGTADSHRLVPARELEHAEEAMRADLTSFLGHGPAGTHDSEVRRYDLTAEREFEEPAEGLAFLRALAGMCPPRHKLKVVSAADGTVQTVYAITPRRGRINFRAYDKGVETETAQAGTRVRLEAQNRPSKDGRRRPGVVARRDLRADFGKTLLPYLQGGDVTVTTPTTAVTHLAGLVAREELSIARAERLIGSVALLREFGRPIYESNDQSSRRIRALREAGVVIDQELPEASTLPVSQLLRQSIEEFAADGP